MSLTRKYLEAMGIENDKIESIIAEHVSVTDAIKKERDDFKKKIEDYEKTEGEYKAKYEKSVKDFDDYKAAEAVKALKAKKGNAVKAILKDLGISETKLDKIIKVTDLDGIELDDDEQIKGLDKVKESLKSEWEEFIVSKEDKGADIPSKPPKGGEPNNDDAGTSDAVKRIMQRRRDLYGGTEKED